MRWSGQRSVLVQTTAPKSAAFRASSDDTDATTGTDRRAVIPATNAMGRTTPSAQAIARCHWRNGRITAKYPSPSPLPERGERAAVGRGSFALHGGADCFLPAARG